jgi:glycosyltransferase involved in cell wall biosynthesis
MLSSLRPDMAWRLWHPGFMDQLARRLSENNRGFDVVQVEGIEMAPYLPGVELAHPRPLIVYDDHNAEWVLQKRACLTDLSSPSRWPMALYSAVQWARLKRYEADTCRRADRVVVASEPDRQAIHAIASDVDARVVPNGVDLDEYSRYDGPTTPFDMVFTGKMDYRPNVDAMLWFCREVLPLIQRQYPNTSLAIVGQRPHAKLAQLGELPGVRLTGWVEDIRPFIAGAAVYVAPLRVGGGTRLKLMQAMAMGACVVSTPLGAEGFPLVHGRQLMLAETPQEFAQAVVTLLGDPVMRERLGQRARTFVQESYGWDALVPRLEMLYEVPTT